MKNEGNNQVDYRCNLIKNLNKMDKVFLNHSMNVINELDEIYKRKPDYFVDKEVIINDNNNHSEMGLPVLRVVETLIGTLL